MAVRLWHQSFTVLQDLGPYAEALAQRARQVTRADTQVDLHGMREGTYPTDYPGTDIRFGVAQYLHGLQFIANGLEAQRQGYDAYVICTLPEPALLETRAALDIPVVGYAESALHTACYLGRRIGILLFIEGMLPQIEHNVERIGLSARVAAIRATGFGFNDVLQGFSDPAPLIARFTAEARALIAQGVDVIVPGEVPLCVLLARNGVSRVDEVPIVDSFAASLMMAEYLVDVRRKLNISVNRRDYFHTAPSQERMAQLAALYGLEAFVRLRAKLDGCLTGCRLAKDRAAEALTKVMTREAPDYPA